MNTTTTKATYILRKWIMWYTYIYIIKKYHRGILSSIVSDDPKPSWVPFGPLCGVINLSIDDHPLIIPVAVSLHLLPGVNAIISPTARLSWLRQLASTSHPHCCLWPGSTCTLKDPVSYKVWHLDVENSLFNTSLAVCSSQIVQREMHSEEEVFNLLLSLL